MLRNTSFCEKLVIISHLFDDHRQQQKRGSIGNDVAYRMMTNGLRKLEDEIDGALLRVHLKTEACQILEGSRVNGQSNSRGAAQ